MELAVNFFIDPPGCYQPIQLGRQSLNYKLVPTYNQIIVLGPIRCVYSLDKSFLQKTLFLLKIIPQGLPDNTKFNRLLTSYPLPQSKPRGYQVLRQHAQRPELFLKDSQAKLY